MLLAHASAKTVWRTAGSTLQEPCCTSGSRTSSRAPATRAMRPAGAEAFRMAFSSAAGQVTVGRRRYLFARQAISTVPSQLHLGGNDESDDEDDVEDVAPPPLVTDMAQKPKVTRRTTTVEKTKKEGELGVYDRELEKMHGIVKSGEMPSKAAVKKLCKMLLRGGRVPDCLDLMAELSYEGMDVENLIPDKFFFEMVCRHDVSVAFQALDTYPRHVRYYTMAVETFGRFGRLADAEEVFAALRERDDGHPGSLRVDVRAYQAMMGAAARARKPRKVARVFRQMREDGLSPNVHVYNTVLDVFARVHSKYSFQAFKEMQEEDGVIPNYVSYNILLKACANDHGRHKQALFLFNKMRREDIPITPPAVSCVMKALTRGGMWEKALELRESLDEIGVKPDVGVWGALMSAAGSAGQVDRAEAILRDMEAAGVRPNDQIFNILIHAAARAGDVQRAEAYLAEMKRRKLPPSLITLNIIICAVALEDLDRAEAMLRDLPGLGMTPDAKTYTSLIDACAEKGDQTRAMMIFAEMEAAGCRPNSVTYTALLRALHAGGSDVPVLMAVFQRMQAAGLRPKENTFTVLIMACIQARDLRSAMSTYQQMRADGYRPHKRQFQELIDLWAEQGMVVGGGPVAGGGSGGDAEEGSAGAALNDDDGGDLAAGEGLGHTPIEPLRWVAVDAEDAADAAAEDYYVRRAAPAGGRRRGAGRGGVDDSEVAGGGGRGSIRDKAESLSIDLHGLSVAEARAAVLCVLRQLQQRHDAGLPFDSDLLIVTGSGSPVWLPEDDAGGPAPPDMRQEILKLSDDIGLGATPPKATRSGSGMLAPVHAGRLVVERDVMQRWLGRRKSREEEDLQQKESDHWS